MAYNVNATPAASQKLLQVVSVSMDGTARVQPRVQTHAMKGKTIIAGAKSTGRAGAEPER